MSSNQPQGVDPQYLRAKAHQITERMRKDPDFVKRLVNDPKTTLVAEGIPEIAVNEVIRGDTPPIHPSVCIATTGCLLTIKACCDTHECG